MCGRASLTKNESDLEESFGASFYTEDIARYIPLPAFNIGPVQKLPFIAQDDPLHFQIGWWPEYTAMSFAKSNGVTFGNRF